MSDEIYVLWKAEWKSKAGDYFFKQFVETYQFLQRKIPKNHKANFRFKTVFLALFSLPPILCFLYQMCSIFATIEHWYELLRGFEVAPLAISFFIGCFLASIAAKWIDIKKYQEAWARHEDHKYRLDREMLKFISNQGEYSLNRKKRRLKDKKRIFMRNVWKIWDGNQEAFVRNMNDREVGLYNILNRLFGK